MNRNPSLGSRIVAHELLIQRLLKHATLVGGIYTMGYSDCLVLTNDLWKHQAGGIPQHCFLLATAMVQGEAPEPEDEEVILLRMTGPTPLPAEAELVQVRADAMREIVMSHGAEAAASSPAILDVLTRNEIQFSAMKTKILGTFYDIEVSGTPLLAFGSDIETIYSASRYKVYKPFSDSLAMIASYPEITEGEERERQRTGRAPNRVRIATVRYSSTRRRRAGTPNEDDVPVRINVDDFISLKTAVFGMTRLGKSNTMKTIATSVFQLASESGRRIGQLLFDPAAEYAQVNVQDQTALAQLGPEFVTIFRYGATAGQAGVRPLSTNFFADATIEVSWAIISAYLTPRNQSNYIRSFLAADVVGPTDEADDYSAYQRARRRRAALYATLIKAGLAPPDNLQVRFSANKHVVSAVNGQLNAVNQAQGWTLRRSKGTGVVL